MLKKIRERMQDDQGFTLIELMVVVLIIAILIAIAIPTFLGLRRRAQDRAAQSDLRNALTNAKSFFADDEAYTNSTAPNLQLQEPSLNFVAAGVASSLPAPMEVSVAISTQNLTDDEWAAARLSGSGTCFYIRDVGSSSPVVGGTFYGSGVGACTGTQALASAVAPAWSEKSHGGVERRRGAPLLSFLYRWPQK
jgi:type IV pilus assembly protein PilA